jgi:hypothetical protein
VDVIATVPVYQATVIPDDVDVDAIAEDALQAGFKVICDRLAAAGYPVTGDVTPGEAVTLDQTFDTFVRMIALNNDAIGAMQP